MYALKMAYTVLFTEHDGWLEVAGKGTIDSFEVFSEKAGTVVRRVMAANAKRILLNDSELVVKLDAFDISRVAEQLEKANLQALGLRLASVCHPETVDTYRTIETIYQNRSINFRLFCDRQTALDWLLS